MFLLIINLTGLLAGIVGARACYQLFCFIFNGLPVHIVLLTNLITFIYDAKRLSK
jgi:hypothetical protein